MKTRSSSRNTNIVASKLNSQVLEQGVGVEGCKLPSPSNINTLPNLQQAGIFGLISAGLYAGTSIVLQFITFAERVFPGIMLNWEKSWFILGVFYMLAGAAHFSVKKDFVNIYPAKGSWGFWYLPGSAEFHVEWTGCTLFISDIS